jgi:hypothetical protein
MIFVHRFVIIKGSNRKILSSGILKMQFNILFPGSLIALQGQHILPTPFTDDLGNLILGAHGINPHNTTV